LGGGAEGELGNEKGCGEVTQRGDKGKAKILTKTEENYR